MRITTVVYKQYRNDSNSYVATHTATRDQPILVGETGVIITFSALSQTFIPMSQVIRIDHTSTSEGFPLRFTGKWPVS